MEDKILNRVLEHYEEGIKRFSKDCVVSCVLHGSQNYHLDFSTSDVDTKLILVPTFNDIVENKPPISKIGFMDNEEQINFKDIRLYIEALRKQNINFVETLFTDWYITNAKFSAQWDRLIAHREEIARLNEYQALRTMIGVMRSEYKHMTKIIAEEDDGKVYCALDGAIKSIKELGYNPKAYANVCRVYEFLNSYIAGCDYQECLIPPNIDFVRRAKQGVFSKEEVLYHAKSIIESADMYESNILPRYSGTEDPETLALLEDVRYEIMKLALKGEFEND